MNFDPTLSNHLSTEILFALVETKLHLLNQMYEMSIAQTDLVAQHEMSPLMTLLSRKQFLMESLQDTQSKLSPFQSQDPEQRVWSSQERRKTCQGMIARCDQLLAQMIVMENRSLDNMGLQREVVAAQLQQNVDASTLQHAYHASDLDDSILSGSLSMEG